MKPQRVYAELRKVMPRDAIVALDAGLAPNFGQDRLDFFQPRSLITSLDLGGLGFSFPAALGAQFAAPGRPVVNFNGDGGFLFNAQEFATAVEYNLPVVTVIMNNGSWGSEKAYQRYAFNERYIGADTLNPSLRQVRRAVRRRRLLRGASRRCGQRPAGSSERQQAQHHRDSHRPRRTAPARPACPTCRRNRKLDPLRAGQTRSW